MIDCWISADAGSVSFRLAGEANTRCDAMLRFSVLMLWSLTFLTLVEKVEKKPRLAMPTGVLFREVSKASTNADGLVLVKEPVTVEPAIAACIAGGFADGIIYS